MIGETLWKPQKPPNPLRVRKGGKRRNLSLRVPEGRQGEDAILSLLPMVRHCVHQIIGRQGDFALGEDLMSAGTVGLIRAARAFDPGRGVKFSTYAYHRVRGAILDEWRRNGSLPPAAYRQLRHIRQRHQELVSELGYPPTAEELPASSDLPRARPPSGMSIVGVRTEGVPDHSDSSPGPAEQAQTHEALDRMRRRLAELPARYRRILRDYYLRKKSMKQIGRDLGLSESRVSQLRACGLVMLRSKMRRGKSRGATVLRFRPTGPTAPLGFFGAA
jgi:RNA polymerase sigma factor for flagellar operon FliA